jgi:hypothetical protein
MDDKIHSDEIGDISVSTTVATIELMGYSPANGKGTGKGKLEHRQTIVMPMDAFLRGAARIRGVLDDLEKKGVIARVPANAGKGKPAKK